MSLPDIDIAVAGERSVFLDRMQSLGSACGRFAVDRHDIGAGDCHLDGVNFRWSGESAHDGLCLQLLAHAADVGRIMVEVSARRWRPDPPSRDAYVKAANMMVLPLLSAFNQQYGERLRLRVERPGAGAFKPTALTRQLLDRFIVCANVSSLHPLDWRRFYELVLSARQEIPTGYLRTALRQGDFSSEKADHLVDLYEHLREFKKLKQGRG